MNLTRLVEAWRTRNVITYGPRLSTDPHYPAMRIGQAIELARESEWGTVTYFDVGTGRVVWRSDRPYTAQAAHFLEASSVGA